MSYISTSTARLDRGMHAAWLGGHEHCRLQAAGCTLRVFQQQWHALLERLRQSGLEPTAAAALLSKHQLTACIALQELGQRRPAADSDGLCITSECCNLQVSDRGILVCRCMTDGLLRMPAAADACCCGHMVATTSNQATPAPRLFLLSSQAHAYTVLWRVHPLLLQQP